VGIIGPIKALQIPVKKDTAVITGFAIGTAAAAALVI
jgi:hypothetical protein